MPLELKAWLQLLFMGVLQSIVLGVFITVSDTRLLQIDHEGIIGGCFIFGVIIHTLAPGILLIFRVKISWKDALILSLVNLIICMIGSYFISTAALALTFPTYFAYGAFKKYIRRE